MRCCRCICEVALIYLMFSTVLTFVQRAGERRLATYGKRESNELLVEDSVHAQGIRRPGGTEGREHGRCIQGDVVAILGPSGSGKTTMLRCLNFLEHADGGTLTFDGEQFGLNTISHRDIARLRRKTRVCVPELQPVLQ